ncbi:PilW family protein [Methylibium rhizosphaerae]|uniref:PilW family protein n=1 Tax=Methylibium rhizosphaerae TaxID=2570323 RepID=UPI00112773EA|nr:PilW family protein [Methylibium rhizosphaerae]
MNARRRARGFGLVEMMVALALGLLIVGGAIAIFLGSRQVSRSTDDLSRIQEGGRFAFELMSRELRESGSTPCGASKGEYTNAPDAPGWVKVSSIIPAPETKWWALWNPVWGYGGSTEFTGMPFGAAIGARVPGTDAIETRSSMGGGESVAEAAAGGDLILKATAKADDLKAGDIAVACDVDNGHVFEVTDASGLNIKMGSLGQGSMKPGSVVARLHATAWYVGQTGRAATGGRALFRATPTGTQEVIDGVQDMQVAYMVAESGQYVDASLVPATSWGQISAVRITLTLQGPQANVATNAAGSSVDDRITRTFTHTVALRNLIP